MKSVKLSIIVPVYNVEKYVGECLDSIIPQIKGRSDVELIIVDDGATDNSAIIVDEKIIDLQNVTFIHQENRGLSGARNTGCDAAKGNFIWFVDSDDFITEQAVLTVLQAITEHAEADIFCTNLKRFYEENNTFKTEKIVHFTAGSGLDYILQKNERGAVPRFIFRREFWTENQLRFVEGILHEDIELTLRAFYFAKRVERIYNVLYVYRIRTSGSIMHTWNIKRLYDAIEIYDRHAEFISKQVATEDRILLTTLSFRFVQNCLMRYSSHMKKQDIDEFYKEKSRHIRKLSWKAMKVMKNQPKLKFFAFFMSISPKYMARCYAWIKG